MRWEAKDIEAAASTRDDIRRGTLRRMDKKLVIRSRRTKTKKAHFFEVCVGLVGSLGSKLSLSSNGFSGHNLSCYPRCISSTILRFEGSLMVHNVVSQNIY